MEWLGLIISLISGAAGGNIAGSWFKNINMGTLWNSVAGVVGGGLGGALVSALGVDPGMAAGAAAGSVTLASILSQLIGGGVGGGILLAVVSYLKKMFAANV